MEVIDPKTAQDAAVNASPANPTAAAPQPDPVKPDNFLPWAIISTILCCLPFGIVAIVYATQVDSYWFSGNYEASRRAAEERPHVDVGLGRRGRILLAGLRASRVCLRSRRFAALSRSLIDAQVALDRDSGRTAGFGGPLLCGRSVA